MTEIERRCNLIYDNFHMDCCLRYDQRTALQLSYKKAINQLQKIKASSNDWGFLNAERTLTRVKATYKKFMS